MIYKVVFKIDDSLLNKKLTLDLGMVKEFATVVLNENNIGTRLWRPFRYEIPEDLLLKEENVLEIKVTNSLANQYGKQTLRSGLSEEITLVDHAEDIHKR